LSFWIGLNSPQWLLEYIDKGITIPFDIMLNPMYLPNNTTVLTEDNVPVVRKILAEYLEYGFIEIVEEPPYCVLSLQLKVTAEKSALIYDMSRLIAMCCKRNLSWKAGQKCTIMRQKVILP
jgi:hypothetical protein